MAESTQGWRPHWQLEAKERELFAGYDAKADVVAMPREQVERLFRHLGAIGSETFTARAILREQAYLECALCGDRAEPDWYCGWHRMEIDHDATERMRERDAAEIF